MGRPAAPAHAPAWMPAWISTLVLALLLAGVSTVNHVVPEPYMDEPFHVPATQRYCAGDFATWDPKITTFPGLYFVGAAYAAATAALLRAFGVTLADTCSTAYLRSVNALLTLASMQLAHAVSYELQRRAWWRATAARGDGRRQVQLQPSARGDAAMRRGALGIAFVTGLLPTQAFFGLLYYTDVASMAALLAAQLLLLRAGASRGGDSAGAPLWGAALAAAAAVGVRQTNAVWVTLMIGGAMLEEVLEAAGAGGSTAASGGGGGGSSNGAAGQAVAVRQRRDGGGGSGKAAVAEAQAAAATAAEPCGLLAELAVALPGAWHLRGRLLARFGPLLLVPAAFAAFVVVNKGITVGDREAHAPVLHLAQPLYFSSFALAAAGALLAAPAAGGGLAGLLAAVRARPGREAACWALAAALAAVAVAQGTLVHPYLLADNRHFTFYIWRRTLGRHPAVRYALLPAHLLGWRALAHGLCAAQRALWVVAFAAAALLTLAPAGLLEFRYFTPGLILALLHLWMPAAPGGSGSSGGGARLNGAALALTAAAYAAVNGGALWLFLARPFAWPDGSVARFMW